MPNVVFTRPEIAKLLPEYRLIRDCLSGETAIKEARTTYLPMPNASDKSRENKERYNAYVARAVFYNVTRRTLSGLVGQVFMIDPIIELPTQLKPLIDNVDGAGVSLTQQSKKVLSNALAFSRAGLLADYPQTEGNVSIADIESGSIYPTITEYSPQEIYNWRTITRGSREILSLLVLCESYIFADDGFEIKNAAQFRVLMLDASGEYVQQIWRENSPTEWNGIKQIRSGNFNVSKQFKPLDFHGNPLREIPFEFVGSDNNDMWPDKPNFYDLASINVAHYRNSADYEESCFIVGQPTPVITGVTEEWVTKVLNGTIDFGSRGGVPLPENADLKLVQAGENTMIKEAMETKERQMVALGAKLVEQKQVQRTAFETKTEATSEGSILSSTAKNVQSAYLKALAWCAVFTGSEGAATKFELNTEFDLTNATPEEQNATVKAWQDGAITFKEMRNKLRKNGLATEDDAEAEATIAAATAKAMAMEPVENTPGTGAV